MSSLQCSTIPNVGLERYQISTPRASKTDFLVVCQAGSKIFLIQSTGGGVGGGGVYTFIQCFSIAKKENSGCLQHKKVL